MEREIFDKGTEVEAFFDDPALRGAWFTATVVRAPGRDETILLEFHTLLAEGKRKKRLQERLKVVNVRPAPPREVYRTFEKDEEVDAFYDDGWWEGVITKVHGNDRFSVYFKCSKEQHIFHASALRLSREWVDDGWDPALEEVDQPVLPEPEECNVPKPEHSSKKRSSKSKNVLSKPEGSNVLKPEGPSKTRSSKSKVKFDKSVLSKPEGSNVLKQKGSSKKHSTTLKVKFEERAQVEISSDDQGYVGAWFVATYVKRVGNNHLVEHKHFFTEDDGTELLKEEVDAQHIRPLPPEILVDDSFKRLEEVDAWYNDSWWVGAISKVLGNSKYVVYFRNTKEEMVFEHSKLRHHQDWIGGEWVRASQDLTL
ncbi:protein AGENET DOMAIN (AGD)-CONTAINING P1 [Macadamia integrifolia]|uniref:protein AGENET DOMAIN (AGD)-CONTAINING P1 n=1 Tax=Macadamia integrifolia TaxID=60698 RepID=UPI001C4EAEC3|nr:protein AGENET DOMAIN (AGD)-CONTAINING P1 [Macadamia integrifolia]